MLWWRGEVPPSLIPLPPAPLPPPPTFLPACLPVPPPSHPLLQVGVLAEGFSGVARCPPPLTPSHRLPSHPHSHQPFCPPAFPPPLPQIGVLAEVFQWRGEVPPYLPGWSAADRQLVGRELSCILLYLVRMADVCGVDLGRAALEQMSGQDAL